jgi:hypothetical protein
MPSSRKHSRYSRNGAASAANACQTEHSELAAGATSAEAGDFIDRTIAIWQSRTERKLTREDGREIIENINWLLQHPVGVGKKGASGRTC